MTCKTIYDLLIRFVCKRQNPSSFPISVKTLEILPLTSHMGSPFSHLTDYIGIP